MIPQNLLYNDKLFPTDTGWPEIDQLAKEHKALLKTRADAMTETHRLRTVALPQAVAEDRRLRAEALRKGTDLTSTPNTDKATAQLEDSERKVLAADEVLTMVGNDLVRVLESNLGDYTGDLAKREADAAEAAFTALDALEDERARVQRARFLARWAKAGALGNSLPQEQGGDSPLLHVKGQNGEPLPSSVVLGALRQDLQGKLLPKPTVAESGGQGATMPMTVRGRFEAPLPSPHPRPEPNELGAER